MGSIAHPYRCLCSRSENEDPPSPFPGPLSGVSESFFFFFNSFSLSFFFFIPSSRPRSFLRARILISTFSSAPGENEKLSRAGKNVIRAKAPAWLLQFSPPNGAVFRISGWLVNRRQTSISRGCFVPECFVNLDALVRLEALIATLETKGPK